MAQIFDELQQIPAGDAQALFECLAAQLKSDKDYHKLFDSRLMQRKHEFTELTSNGRGDALWQNSPGIHE